MLELDVRDEASVQSCVREVLAHAGTIDVLIANAGEMVFGAIEEVPLDDARRMFDTNFWGAARVVGAALPSMRARGRGRVLLVGSVAGHTAIPMNGYYAASKAALARYAEALRHEVMHLGVHVSLIEPSDYRTRFWDHARIAPSSIEAYARLRDRVLGAVRMLISEAPAPTPVADVLLAAVESNTPRGTYRVGAWANRLPRMRAWMPAVMFEAGVRRRFGLDALHR